MKGIATKTKNKGQRNMYLYIKLYDGGSSERKSKRFSFVEVKTTAAILNKNCS